MRPIFIIAVILLTQLTYGQTLKETRTASLVDGDYSLDGTVYLELFDDNSLNLRFGSDYLTQSNVFDVHVFLSTTNNYQRPIDTSNMLLVSNIGTESGLDYSSGARTFNLPSGVGISDYQYIVFVCIRYGRLHWGNGTFGEVTIYALGISLGYALVIFLFSAIREEMDAYPIKKNWQGIPIALITAFIMAMIFVGFGGIV